MPFVERGSESNGVDKNQVFPKESPYERIISSKKLDEGWCLGE